MTLKKDPLSNNLRNFWDKIIWTKIFEYINKLALSFEGNNGLVVYFKQDL